MRNIHLVLGWILIILLCFIFGYCVDTYKPITFKAIIYKKSIDTLDYRCGYKRKYICRGVFNRLFLKGKYGCFIDDVNLCYYRTVNVGDSLMFTGNRVQLWLWYDIHIPADE